MPFRFSAVDEVRKQLPFFLTTIGYDWPQEPIRRPEGYQWYQWIHCLSGRGELQVGGRTHEIREGMGFFLMPDEPHEYKAMEEGWVTDWIGFGGFAVPEVLRFVGLQGSGVFEVSEFWKLKSLVREVFEAEVEGSAIAFHTTSVLVYEVLLALRTALEPRTRDARPRHTKLRPVLHFLGNHYAEQVDIDAMAAVIDVTPQYLCQLFKQTLQMRPFEYLTALRVSKAKEFLVLHPEMTLAQIAKKSGFSDANYLCRVFRKVEGVSPGVFRGGKSDGENP